MPYPSSPVRPLRFVRTRPLRNCQRQWLERIGQQLKKETVMDKAALDQGQFKAQGGFKRIDKVFGGRIEQALTDLNAQIWLDASYYQQQAVAVNALSICGKAVGYKQLLPHIQNLKNRLRSQLQKHR
ncbi:type I restriction-modification enzyme R subunit C-terminal domain-containing protein [Nodosilinea sp. AN01ver1]|uniref:type I restriction-modification enzyme R subunit C-terminal domain-containing protein n=1 Tax=Nodosilinea sp. AN01ver1 TaxID=3423362 RepID=UPI003D314BAA